MYVCMYHLSVKGHLGCFIFWLLWIVLLWRWVQKCIKTLLSVPLGKYPEMELLDHTVVLFLIFWGTTTLFHIELYYFTLPLRYLLLNQWRKVHQSHWKMALKANMGEEVCWDRSVCVCMGWGQVDKAAWRQVYMCVCIYIYTHIHMYILTSLVTQW